MRRAFTGLGLVALLAWGLAGCGKYGPPVRTHRPAPAAAAPAAAPPAPAAPATAPTPTPPDDEKQEPAP